MATYTKKQYATMTGMSTRELSVYIKRGKVIVTKEDEVDDENPKNRAFLIRKGGVPESKEVDGGSGRDNSEDEEAYYALEKEKLKQQVEKLRNENRKLKLNNEKTVGSFVPVDHVGLLIIQLSEAIHLAWENEFEDFVTAIGGKFNLTRDQITDYKKQKVNSSNISRERAVKEAKKMLRRLQNKTSDSRGVGEHD